MTYQTLRNEIEALQKRIDEASDECRKYNHAGCNADTHEKLNRVLAILTG